MAAANYVVKCCLCHRVRTEQGWEIEHHGKGVAEEGLRYSHGYCPSCYRETLMRLKAVAPRAAVLTPVASS